MAEYKDTSRRPGFYNLSLEERQSQLDLGGLLSTEELAALTGAGLTPEQADPMIENVVGTHALPLGMALNFVVNGRDALVPGGRGERWGVAGASFRAKRARAGGGFRAEADEPEMIGQMQLL